MDTKRWWIVGHDDKTWGPFERAALADLVAQGKLRSDGLVCAEGEQRWVPIGQVDGLREIPWPPPAHFSGPSQTPLSSAPALQPAAPGVPPHIRPNELEPIPGWATVLLSFPTLGLWGMFCFYRTMRAMMRLCPNAAPRAETMFWAFLGAIVLGVITLPLLVGVVLLVGAVILGALLLREALRLRELAVLRLVPQAATSPAHYPALKSDDWHFGLWVTGAVLTVTGIGAIVGVPILIAQALAWFEDWNRLAGLARANNAVNATPLPA